MRLALLKPIEKRKNIYYNEETYTYTSRRK